MAECSGLNPIRNPYAIFAPAMSARQAPSRDSGHSNGSLSLWDMHRNSLLGPRFQKPGFVAGEDDTAYRAVESGIPGRRRPSNLRISKIGEV